MSRVIPFKKEPTVVWKNGRSGKWGDAEGRALETLLAQGLSVPEVIRLTINATGRSEASIRHKINTLREVRRPKQESRYASHLTSGPPAPKQTGLDPESPVALMLATLRDRVRCDQRDYFLDGMRSSFYACVKEANRVRKGRGEKQITGSPEWEAK